MSLEKPSNTYIETDVKTLDQNGGADWSPEEEKALVYVRDCYLTAYTSNHVCNRKKIDLKIFPMLCLVFGMSLLDRTNISAAYIAGAGEDLGLTFGYVLSNV
jgi:hypothetical protein